MGTFADSGGAQTEGSGAGRIRLGRTGSLRLRASLMLVLYEKGWSLRQLAGVFGVRSPSTIHADIRAIPPEAAERFKALAADMLGDIPNPDEFNRGAAKPPPQPPEPRIARTRRPPMVLPWARTHPSPEARRLAAEAAIDARCLEALERRRGGVREAAKALGITAARVRAAVVRKSDGGSAE